MHAKMWPLWEWLQICWLPLIVASLCPFFFLFVFFHENTLNTRGVLHDCSNFGKGRQQLDFSLIVSMRLLPFSINIEKAPTNCRKNSGGLAFITDRIWPPTNSCLLYPHFPTWFCIYPCVSNSSVWHTEFSKQASLGSQLLQIGLT